MYVAIARNVDAALGLKKTHPPHHTWWLGQISIPVWKNTGSEANKYLTRHTHISLHVVWICFPLLYPFQFTVPPLQAWELQPYTCLESNWTWKNIGLCGLEGSDKNNLWPQIFQILYLKMHFVILQGAASSTSQLTAIAPTCKSPGKKKI